MGRPRIAVVGAGIGGLAATIALLRKGFRVDLYEQASQLREVGVGLHLGSNGSRILHRWGLSGQLDELGVRPVALQVRHFGDGRVLYRQPMGAEWEAEFGGPYYTIHRADLHRILADLVPPERIHLDHRLAGFADTGEAVRLRMSSGAEAEADLLVGADGIHSLVRRTITGPDTPIFSGTSAFRGLVPSDGLPLPARTMFVWPGPHSRLLCYPVSGGRFLTFVAIVPDMEWVLESWSAPGDPADVAAAFAGWNSDVTAVVGAVTETRRWALYDREPLQSWSAGRITLLGDAAHPMLPHHGQGASQSIEDAVALAHCLDAEPDIPTALRRYESVRRPHTARVQLGSRGSGSMRLQPTEPGALPSLVEDVSWIQRYDVAAELARG